MRILFFATYPTQPTGYARIGNILSNYLANAGHEVHYVGISHYPQQAVERDIHPFIHFIDALAERKEGSTELYGVDIMCDKINQIKPDLVFIYNDMLVINRIINDFITTKMPKTFKFCVYLDLVYDYQRLLYLRNIAAWADVMFVFSDCWKKNMMEVGFPAEKIAVLPHGFDADLFRPMNSVNAKLLMGFAADDFVVLNTNRNAYRKAHDITIEAFVKFLKKRDYHPRIKLFLNLVQESLQGYKISDVIQIVCMKNQVDYEKVVTKHIFVRPSHLFLADEKLNTLYNACDVGLNTCLGEGFGLCNLEHACVGKPQIVSKVGALADIFTPEYATLIKPKVSLYLAPMFEDHQGYIHICDSEDFVAALDTYYDDRILASWHGTLARDVLTKKYEWATILEDFNTKLLSL